MRKSPVIIIIIVINMSIMIIIMGVQNVRTVLFIGESIDKFWMAPIRHTSGLGYISHTHLSM